MKIRAAIPELNGIENWLNSKPLRREDLIGRWTLIYFWSMSCASCREQFNRVQQMCDKYKQLHWISVHMPRSEGDKDLKHVKQYVKAQNRTEPVALDQQLLLTDRFGVRFVPSYYVFDEAGLLRHYQSGDQSLNLLERRLQRFLTE